MTTHAVERVEGWNAEPFSGGYRRLHDLVDRDFSGVVTAGRAKLCLLNGTAVGVLDGDIRDFDDAEGTIYTAPSPALPLLAVMQERSDEVRAKYYTEETPLAEVDDTLSSGGFTGYVELSENVLSGDYYVVYHRGRSMAVAFIGESSSLSTDDDAFDTANDEVGIYEVRPADIEPVEIPEPDEPDDDGTTVAAAGTTAAAGEDAEAGADAGESGAADDAKSERETETTASDDGQPRAEDGTPEQSGDENAESDGNAGSESATGAAATPAAGSADPDTGGDATGTTAGDDDDQTDTAATAASDTSTATAPDADATGTSERGVDDDAPPGGAGSSAGTDERDATARDTAAADADEHAQSRSSGQTTGDQASEQASQRPESASDPARADARPESDDRAGQGAGRGRRQTEDTGRSSGQSEQAAGREAASTGAAGQLETHSIPSLDPARTKSPAGERTTTTASTPRADPASPQASHTPGASRRQEPAADEDTQMQEARRDRPASDQTGQSSESGRSRTDTRERASESAGGAGADDDRRQELEQRLEEKDDELDRLDARVGELEDERDRIATERDEIEAEREELRAELNEVEVELEGLQTERDELEAERDELRAQLDERDSEIEALRGQLKELQEQYGAAPNAEHRLNPRDALAETNLFVRYSSKGAATLESAHGGGANRQEVNENLGLEYHTQFDASSVAVAGKSFDAFLPETIEFRFVTWAIRHLLFEIHDTGKVNALRDLYDAIPKVDRAQLKGSVDVEYTEDGQTRQSQEQFDVVLRDKMGNPLLVANLNDSRDATTENMMSALITASTHVAETNDTLAGGFIVTSSFFEPDALETASDATSGGLLSRDKRESFVKLSRKQGYHLCLVESREGNFHLAVPEL